MLYDIGIIQSFIERYASNTYYVDEQKVYKRINKKGAIEIGTLCFVSKIFYDIITLQYTIEITYIANGNVRTTKCLERSVLSETNVGHLLNWGLTFSASVKKDFFTYLISTEEFATSINVHSNIGYQTIEGKPTFLLDKAYSKDNHIQSTLKSQYDLSEKGSLKATLDCIRSEIIGQNASEFIVLSSVVASMLSFLPQEATEGHSLLISLVGSSSRGKSTIAKFASSLWGSPTNKGVFHDSNVTNGALHGIIENHKSVFHVFDERESFSKEAMTTSIYSLTSGSGRRRLGVNGVNEQKTFQVVIVFTSEVNITNDEAKNGQLVRHFELDDDFIIFKDKKSAEKVARISSNNYGLLIKTFVKWLMSQDIDEIIDEHKRFIEKLSQLPDNNFVNRVKCKYALFLLSAQLFNQCFGETFHFSSIMKTIESLADKLSSATNKEMDFQLYISNFVYQYKTKFTQCSAESWGNIMENGDVFILKPAFEKNICVKYSDVWKSNLKKLKNENLIRCEKDRLTYRTTISNNKVEGYYFKAGYINSKEENIISENNESRVTQFLSSTNLVNEFDELDDFLEN